MVTKDDIILIELTKEEVFDCIDKVKQNNFIDNLRDRHPNVSFDCKLRGYVGETAISKWFNQQGIELNKTDYLEDGDNIDIDFLVKGKNIELKTSLIPDTDGDLDTVLVKRDIKLIKRWDDTIEQLRGDIHLQIYYKQKTKEKDNWLKEQYIDLSSDDKEYLYQSFSAEVYLNTSFFVAWIDKVMLIEKINSLPQSQRCWSFPGSKRFFWSCKLNQSRKPIELIEYLKNL
jgi:hypothetical protein